MILYLCQCGCWRSTFGFAEKLAENQGAMFQQACPECKKTMKRYNTNDKVLFHPAKAEKKR